MNTDITTTVTTAEIETLLRNAEAAHAKAEITTPHDWVPFYASYIIDALKAAQAKQLYVSEAEAMFRATTLSLI